MRSIAERHIVNRILFFLVLLLALSNSSYGDEQGLDVDLLRRRITEEAPGELVNLNLNDSSISLRIAGRWKGSIQAGLGLALTPLGTKAITDDTPFFTQEGDLTLSLWIRDRWFVESSFMDDSALNTYRAGYEGKEGEVVRYVGIGNTGLDFPVFPYLDLGGDSPSSFGAYGHFQAGNLAFHSLVRYDAAAREEKVFVGDRERNFGYTDLSRPQRGISFVLPDDKLSAIPEVYIQDNKGKLEGSDGKRWRPAEPSEFGASAWFGLVELTLGAYTGGMSEPEGMIAVYYPGGYNIGKYYMVGANDTFLGNIQYYFDKLAAPASAPTSVRLWDYPQPGQRSSALLGDPDNVPATVTINGISALVIYEPGTFSPFEKQNRYIAPANTSSQAALVKLSTGNSVAGFNVIPHDDNYIDAAIVDPGQNRIIRGVYELIQEGSNSRRSPEECWPLGNMFPDLYLPGKKAFTEDLGIRFTNYSAPGVFYLGSDVVPGSVQVFRNGIQDPNFAYSQSGGVVNLTNPAGFNELIRISYLKQSSERRLGSLAAGIGAIWDSGGHFSGKLGLGLRWNISSDAYSENGASSPGNAGLGIEAKWTYDHIKAGLTMGMGMEQPDTTGLYRITGMEGNEIILPLPPGSSFLSETPVYIDPFPTVIPIASYLGEQRIDLNYRNYRETSFLGTSSLKDISVSSPIVPGQSGPYPAMDKYLSSQALVAEFDLPSQNAWTGFETPLGLNSEFIGQAGKIEIPYRFMNFSHAPAAPPGPVDFSVILQIGALSDEGAGSSSGESFENPNIVMQKILFPPQSQDNSGGYNPAEFNYDARIAVFNLSDYDRLKLSNAKYMRILIVKTSSAGELSGRVILAPPIARGALWRPVSVRDDTINPIRGLSGQAVSAYEDIDSSLEIKYPDIIQRLHTDKARQRVLEISWEAALPGDYFSSDGTGLGADGRIPAAPLSSYRSLSFFIRCPSADDSDRQIDLDKAVFRFIIADGPSSLKRRSEITLDIKIPLMDFKNNDVNPGEWTRVDIQDIGSNPKVMVNNRSASSSSVATAIGFGVQGEGEGRSVYAAFFLIPGSANFPEGNMAIDEIFLEDTIPSYRMNNGANLDWNLPGAFLSIGKQALISDISFQAAIETGAQGNPFEDNANGSFGMNGRSRTGFSLLGIKISGNYAYSVNSAQGMDTNYTWSAGHGLSRSFGPFSVRESFDDAPGDKTMDHRVSFALGTKIRANLSGELIREDENQRRRWQAGTGGTPVEKIPLDFSLDASMGINEKTGDRPELSNYAYDWLDSFIYLLPDSGWDAENRDLRINNRIRLTTLPFGTELYFYGLSSFNKPRSASQSSSLFRLDFPIYPGINNDLRLLFRAEREYRRDIFIPSRDFREDGNIWAGSLGDSVPLMFSIPIYSLFNSSMGNYMDEFGAVNRTNEESNPDLAQFADRYEFSLSRAVNYGVSSLFIPRRLSFRLGRILERRLDTPRDTVSFGAALSFSSVNMFGAMGAAPLFNFYMGDEISHSLETVFSFPKNESVSWTVRADQSMLFFGFSEAELDLKNTMTVNSSNRIGEGNRWSDSLTASWTAPMEKTLLGSVYGFFAQKARTQDSWLTLANLANSEYELLRRETLEFVLEKIPDLTYGGYVRFSITGGHESIVRIFGRLNLSVFTKLTVSEDYNTRILSFLASIGTSLNLMF